MKWKSEEAKFLNSITGVVTNELHRFLPDQKYLFYFWFFGAFVPCATNDEFDEKGNIIVVMKTSEIPDGILDEMARCSHTTRIDRAKVDIVMTNAHQDELLRVFRDNDEALQAIGYDKAGLQ